jgi:hypothetical protein
LDNWCKEVMATVYDGEEIVAREGELVKRSVMMKQIV